MLSKKWFAVSMATALMTTLFSCAERSAYHVGDIVLSDGSVLSRGAFGSYKGEAKPVSVIFSTHGADSENSLRVLGVAVSDEAEEMLFAQEDLRAVISAEAHFQAASVKKQERDEKTGVFKNSGFTGNLDGRKVLYNLSEKDRNLIAENKDLFPAVQAAERHGFSLSSQKYVLGWYLPSIAELYELFRARKEVNESLAAVGGSEITRQKYWSSSSAYGVASNNYCLDAATGEVIPAIRHTPLYVRAVYCFSEEKSNTKASAYNIGDIVLENGVVLNAAEFAQYAGEERPVAVIFSTRGGHFEESERVLGVGLSLSDALAFAPEGSVGERTNMLANQSMLIAQEFKLHTGKYSNDGFVGLLDGRNTWKNIAFYDKKAKDSFNGYPAFNFAVNYGKAHGFKKYATGWYLPTASEAYELAEYADIVNRSLVLCGAEPFNNFVWTSSQDYNAKNNQYIVDMVNANVQLAFKNTEYLVCSIYCFSEKN